MEIKPSHDSLGIPRRYPVAGIANLLPVFIRESNYMFLDFNQRGQMQRLPRTIRDRDLSDILKRLGSLTNKNLAREASKYPHFSGMSDYAIEKAVDRFVKDYEALGIVVRDGGKIEWVSQASKSQEQHSKENDGQPSPTSLDVQHETVQNLMQGLANGYITLRDKPLQNELKGMEGRLYDRFMEDIDLYNRYKNTPLISDTLERRVFEMVLKLRAYGFIEERGASDKKEST